MLDVKTWVIGKLSASAPLLALLGDPSHILTEHPRDFGNLPKITYSELNQSQVDDAFFDDASSGALSLIEIHVWSDPGSGSAIVKAVDSVMTGLLFSITYSADVPDPTVGIQHRCIRYRRLVNASALQ